MDESGLPAGFMEQLGSGVGANLITVLCVAVLLCVRNCSKRKFKHSACKSCCFSVELDEDSSEDSKSASDKDKKHDNDRQRDSGNIV